MSYIYLDNSATTQVSDSVFNAMVPYLRDSFGNPSSIYKLAREAKIAVEAARKQVATALNADASEIYFTSCGSEADNWAIKSIARFMATKGKKHLITSVFEHHAVLHTMASLEKEGFTVTYIPVDKNGLINPEDIRRAITPETALVTIMYANNEIGTVQPIPEIGAICHENKVLFHTDAVQAIGNIDIDVKAQNIDLLSLSGHKIHAPKGIGALYCRKGIILQSFIDGGGQERGRRAGTENVASIVGLGVAMQEACSGIAAKQQKLCAMRDRLIEEILKIPHTRLNGDPKKRLCTNVNISFEGIEGESLLLMLDLKGICASSGSACTSGSLDPSHVLLSIGLRHEVAHGSLRLSLSEYTTDEEIDYVLSVIPPIAERLRAMSPLWEKIIKSEQ